MSQDADDKTPPSYPEADFYEPVTFQWSEEGYRVRQALRRYCEALDSDPFGSADE